MTYIHIFITRASRGLYYYAFCALPANSQMAALRITMRDAPKHFKCLRLNKASPQFTTAKQLALDIWYWFAIHSAPIIDCASFSEVITPAKVPPFSVISFRWFSFRADYFSFALVKYNELHFWCIDRYHWHAANEEIFYTQFFTQSLYILDDTTVYTII